jgi:hypothetical protein
MSEATMVERLQEAITDQGIDDRITVAGQFEPRGHTGALFAGGLIGGEIGGTLGNLGDAVGVAAGSIAGMHVHDAASGLPDQMLVGVSDRAVYGFAGRSRRAEPSQLVFQVARADLEVKVHQRANVRVLELIHGDSGSAIELEGNRLPVTHSHDVIEALGG